MDRACKSLIKLWILFISRYEYFFSSEKNILYYKSWLSDTFHVARITVAIDNGALHTRTETGFTEFGSSIGIQCGLRISTAGLDFMHCPRALSRSTTRSSDPDRGRVEAKWYLDP